MNSAPRETLASRIGFLLLAAGCAVGLGNVWRFPYVTGHYGGAMFVLFYILFLAILGFPIMTLELAVGRASRRGLVGAAETLASARPKIWRRTAGFIFIGNAVLMMFYTTVSGWMLAYFWKFLSGAMEGVQGEAEVGACFKAFLASPLQTCGWMVLACALSAFFCGLGLRNGTERTVKWLMASLFLMIFLLAVRSLTLPNALAGVEFYLKPSLSRIQQVGWLETLWAAMGQAFFTLSLGIGSMAIFGSYASKQHSLAKESVFIIGIDLLVALLSGLIIFPACASYGVNPGQGPTLIMETLPNIFCDPSFWGGRWFGAVFFLFLSIAALTTVIAVFENLIAYFIDECGMGRKFASGLVFVGVTLLSIPCALGFNALSWIQPMGKNSNILVLEDFLVSNNLLPLGCFFLAIFCVSKRGWGWKNFLAEANEGTGLRFPSRVRLYMTWILPTLVLILLAAGYWNLFFRGSD